MLDELTTNMMLSPTIIAGCVMAAVAIFSAGWFGKGAGAHKREAALKRDVLEAKRSIPQLESTVRNRDTQITRLEEELKDLNDRTNELHRSNAATTKELKGATREAKNLTSELAAVKGLSKDNSGFIMDGFDDEAAPESEGDSALQSQLNKTLALYEKLKTALIQRDERIEALESQTPDSSDLEIGTDSDDATDAQSGATQELEQVIADRDQTIEALQSQITNIRNEKEMLEDLASRRSKSNRVLKDASTEAKSKLPKLEREIETVNQTVADREASIKRLLGEQEQTKQELSEQIDQRNALQAELETSRQQLEISSNQLSQLEASLNQREERITGLDRELVNSNETIAAVRSQMRANEQSAETQKIAFDTEVQKLQELAQASATLQGTIKDRNFRIDSLQADNKKLQDSLSSTQREVTDTIAITNKRQEVAASEVNDSQQQLDALRREVEDLRANLSQREQWMDKLKESLNERETRLSELQARTETLSTELSTANEQLKSHEATRHELGSRTHEIEREIVAHKTKAQQAEGALQEQTQSINVLKSMISDRDFKIETLENDLLALRDTHEV